MTATPLMLAKPEEISTHEKRQKYTVATIGCEKSGQFHAILFADAGFKVICADPDPARINNMTKGRITTIKGEAESKLRTYLKEGSLNATTDVKQAASQSNIIVMTIPAKFDAKKRPDYSDIKNICKIVGSNFRAGSIIFNMSITGIGINSNVLKETLENASGFKEGEHFGLVYAPTPASESSTLENVRNYARIVAASDKKILDVGSAILATVTKGTIRKAESMKIAEVAALLEIVYEDTRIALKNELSYFCEKVGTDFLQIQALIGAIPDQGSPSTSSSIGKIQDEPYILLEDAENASLRLKIPNAAREVNEETAKHAANLTKDALRVCGKTLKRARVTLLGVALIPNAATPPSKFAKEIAKTLEARGARLNVYDPYCSESELADMQHHPKKTLNENLERADCIVLLTAHNQFKNLNLAKLKHLMKVPAAIIDLTGTLDPSKVEKEGFIYRGLGRGVWTK